MAGLVDTKIKDSYKSVLRVNDNTDGVDATAKYIGDGEGTASSLSISTGNIGIGTVVPNAKLEASGDIFLTEGADRTIKVTTATGGGTADDLTVKAGDIQNTGDNQGGDLKLLGGDGLYTDNTGGNVYIAGGADYSGADGDVVLAHTGGASRGKVGIGTAAPAVKLDVAGGISATGLYKGYMPWIIEASFNDTGADTVFIPLGSSTSENTAPNADGGSVRLCMPYVGYLEKIIFRCQSTADTCDFEIYKAPSGTDADATDQNKLSSTVSVEDDAAHTLKTVTFGTSYSFAAGDVMAIKMTYESTPNDIDMTIVWRVLVD